MLLAYCVGLVYFSLSILLNLFPSLFTYSFSFVIALLISVNAVLVSAMR
jgi:hypothetical protein